VFTGTLMSMTRRIAWDECACIGAIAEEDTTRRTNVLVVGDINPAVLRPGSTVTGKTRKAFELQAKGQRIEVMTEGDFVRCLATEEIADGATASVISGRCQELTGEAAVPSSIRKLRLAQRPMPKPPKPLRRNTTPINQSSSIEG
ncbi:MAG: hypothetical protein J0H22_15615, partial [Actinobacteria bacterium]|nr:hypothetical protein [Actinomycetota bacterium]